MIQDKSLLSSSERIAGYLFYSCKLAMLGAKLRKDGRQDESWTYKEGQKWDDICDEIDAWFLSLSKEEKDIIDNTGIIAVLAKITVGESIIKE